MQDAFCEYLSEAYLSYLYSLWSEVNWYQLTLKYQGGKSFLSTSNLTHSQVQSWKDYYFLIKNWNQINPRKSNLSVKIIKLEPFFQNWK